MKGSPDVVVVGGGIVGATCAYYLTLAGARVCLVERDYPASGTSRACDGLILLWDKGNPAELALGQESARMWAELAQEQGIDCEYSRHGTVLLAENDAALEAGCRKAADLSGAGVRAEILEGRRLQALEPHLAPDLAGGVYFPDDAQVDPRRATVSLLDGSRRLGLTLRCGSPVSAIRLSAQGSVTGVAVGGDEVACGAVVCAAGVWSNELAGLVGAEIPVKPRKGHILVTARAPGIVRHPLLEGSYVATVQSAGSDAPQVALVAEPTAGGTLLLGSSREFAGFDRSISQATVQAIAARAARFLPGLRNVSIIRSYAGLRPWSPDHLPFVGPVESVPGFYLATGHEGAGIGLAPVTGQLIAKWLTGQALPPLAHQLLPGRLQH